METTSDSPEWERAAAAYYELLGNVRRLQKWTLLIPAAIAIVPGALGVIAHATGHWSVLGTRPDGMYYVSRLTIVAAFILPAAPIVVAGYVAYKILRWRVIARWFDDAARKYALPRDVLEERAAGLR